MKKIGFIIICISFFAPRLHAQSSNNLYADCLTRYLAFYNTQRPSKEYYHLKEINILDYKPVLNYLPRKIDSLQVIAIKFNNIQKLAKKRSRILDFGSKRSLNILNISDLIHTNENLVLIEINENCYYVKSEKDDKNSSLASYNVEHVQIAYEYDCKTGKYIFNGIVDLKRGLEQYITDSYTQNGSTLYQQSLKTFIDSLKKYIPDSVKTIQIREYEKFKNYIHYSYADTIAKYSITTLDVKKITELNISKRLYNICDVFVNEKEGLLIYNIKYFSVICKSKDKINKNLRFEADIEFKYNCVNKIYTQDAVKFTRY